MFLLSKIFWWAKITKLLFHSAPKFILGFYRSSNFARNGPLWNCTTGGDPFCIFLLAWPFPHSSFYFLYCKGYFRRLFYLFVRSMENVFFLDSPALARLYLTLLDSTDFPWIGIIQTQTLCHIMTTSKPPWKLVPRGSRMCRARFARNVLRLATNCAPLENRISHIFITSSVPYCMSAMIAAREYTSTLLKSAQNIIT